MVDRHEDLDGYTVNFCRFRQDIDATPMLKGLPGDRCDCPHWGYVLKGRLTYRFADHEEVFVAGDAFYLPPGHVPVAEAGSELVQFSPRDELATVTAAMMRNMQAMQGALRRRYTRTNSSSGRRPCCIAKRLARARFEAPIFSVDVLDVVGDRLRCDHEVLGDRLVRQPAREQPQDLDLPRGEPRRTVAAAHHAMTGGAEHRLDGLRVEAARRDICAQLGARLVRRTRRAVRPRLAHRLIGVGGAEDACRA